MPLYHTTLFSNDPPGDAFISRGAAWSFEKASGVHRGPRDKMFDYSMKLFQQRGHAATANHMSGSTPVFFDMEIMIRAEKPKIAQQAMSLFVSAIAVLEGSITFCPEPFSIDPREVGNGPYTTSFMSKTGLLDACRLANRASRKRSLSYAVHKLAELRPYEAPRRASRQGAPPPSKGKPSWSRGNVRDVSVSVIDALALASWLRSSTTTHRFSKTTRSLTVYDAHNVQSLARYLIMEKFGFWRRG